MATLTDQQRLFAQEYIRSGFDRLAAIKAAGYSEHSGKTIASQLLAKKQVQAEISRLVSQIEEKSSVEIAEVIAALRRIAFAEPTAKVSNSDRIRCLELLGRSLCLFKDGLSVSAEQNPRQLDAEEMEALQAIARANNIRLACPNRPNLPPVDADFTPKDSK